MKSQPRNSTATKALLFGVLMWCSALAWAGQVAGTVRNLSGPLMAKKADGRIKVLSVKSEVEEGDTLVSEKNTYALIRFIDNSEITLKPGSSFKIESFAYDESRPEADSATFNLVKGGLRSVTGLLGKRNKEKFEMKTPTATIGIRGTTFIAQYVPPPPPGGRPDLNAGPALPPGGSLAPGLGSTAAKTPAPSGPPPLAPGLHVSVTDGAIIVTNTGGSLGFQAGQFGYVPNVNQPPVIVPSNPNIQFVPPPSFDAGSGDPTASNGPGQGQATDCIVR